MQLITSEQMREFWTRSQYPKPGSREKRPIEIDLKVSRFAQQLYDLVPSDLRHSFFRNLDFLGKDFRDWVMALLQFGHDNMSIEETIVFRSDVAVATFRNMDETKKVFSKLALAWSRLITIEVRENDHDSCIVLFSLR